MLLGLAELGLRIEMGWSSEKTKQVGMKNDGHHCVEGNRLADHEQA